MTKGDARVNSTIGSREYSTHAGKQMAGITDFFYCFGMAGVKYNPERRYVYRVRKRAIMSCRGGKEQHDTATWSYVSSGYLNHIRGL